MDLGHMNVVLKWMYLYVASVFMEFNCEVMYLYVENECENWNYL